MSDGNLWVLDRFSVRVQAGDVVAYYAEKTGHYRGIHKIQYAVVLDVKLGEPHPLQKTRMKQVKVVTLLLIREPPDGAEFRLRRQDVRRSEFFIKMNLDDHGHLPWSTLVRVIRSRLAMRLGIPKLKGREWAAQELIDGLS